MFKEKYENAKRFVKEHKAEIIAGGLVIGGLIIRHHDLKTTEKHLLDIMNLMDKEGNCVDKLIDVAEHHSELLKLTDEQIEGITKVLENQVKLDKVIIEDITKLNNK